MKSRTNSVAKTLVKKEQGYKCKEGGFCGGASPRRNICDGTMADCWEKGMKLCNADKSCTGVVAHAKSWTSRNKGVQLCTGGVKSNKEWVARMKGEACPEPLTKPLVKGPPMKPLKNPSKGPPMKPLVKPLGKGPKVSPPAASGSTMYEYFTADCTGAVIKTIQGDDPAAQSQCSARAACAGWSVNKATGVRKLRGKDCKKHAAGDWVYFKKMNAK